MPDFALPAEGSDAEKIALRHRLLAARNAMSLEHRAAAAGSLHTSLLELLRERRPATIAAYVPIGTEPGGDLPVILARHARVLLPVLRPDRDLDWAVFDGAYQPGPRGLREPAGPRLDVQAIREADLILVPALAVDASGMRLGRGGGSYDRVLARVGDSALTVALLYDGELVERVPAEPHDRPVRATITPSAGFVLTGHPPGDA
jgi:5-formyltetrahydrofolate cyclo-ligase